MVQFVEPEEVRFLVNQYITILCTIQLMCKKLGEKTNHVLEEEIYQLHTNRSGIMECLYYQTLIRETIVHFMPLVGVPSIDMKRAIYSPSIVVKTKSLDQATFWRVLDRGDFVPQMTRTRFVSVQMIIQNFQEMMYEAPYHQNMYRRKFQLGSSSIMLSTDPTTIRRDRQYISILADALKPLLDRGYKSDSLPHGLENFLSGPRLLRRANSKSRSRSNMELKKMRALLSQGLRERSYEYAMQVVKSKGSVEVINLNTPMLPARVETVEGMPSPRPQCSSDGWQTDKDQHITGLSTFHPNDTSTTDSVSQLSAPGTVESEQTTIDNMMDKHFEQLSEMLPQNVLEEYFYGN